VGGPWRRRRPSTLCPACHRQRLGRAVETSASTGWPTWATVAAAVVSDGWMSWILDPRREAILGPTVRPVPKENRLTLRAHPCPASPGRPHRAGGGAQEHGPRWSAWRQSSTAFHATASRTSSTVRPALSGNRKKIAGQLATSRGVSWPAITTFSPKREESPRCFPLAIRRTFSAVAGSGSGQRAAGSVLPV